ncbi:hypothetical protein [Hymenobacter lucidus]|uniref:Uncharacterized protein n=1 Tax=Hymenobacter lucidus TaxID=2880930 RepID=A0ABS8AMX9_9BACT|nr:hypothetical protein [Hymenobacter lucidus]MCB2407398.1 hypothetical protein [Hymenobacter lucidus]
MTTLLRFLELVFRLAPRLLWWALGGLFFSGLNIVLKQELWPNTSAAPTFFAVLFVGCLLLLPWLAARTAWLLADAVESYFWKALWRLAAIGGYCGAALSAVVGVVALAFNL